MGARPSTFRRGGGGFLNGVDGVISGYMWTDAFNGEPFVPGKKSKENGGGDKFHSLFLNISARLDGADEDISQHLWAGGYDDFEVSEDGLTLTSAAGGECAIGGTTDAGKFLSSLVEAGFPESKFSDDPDSVNLEPMVGSRVRFGQSITLDKAGKPKKRIAKTGKFKGREFDVTTTVIEQVYEAGGGKSAGKATTAKKGKPAPAEDEDADSVESLATKFLIKIVTANKGKMAKGKVSMQLLKPENGLFKHPKREAIRKLLNSDKFLNTEDGWSYNEDKEIITVEVAEDGDDD